MFLKIVTAVLGLFTCELQAQNSVTLNVKLYPIQTLLVNSSQNNVDLEYVNREDYKNGVTSEQQDHLTIYSTGGFQVKVSAVAITADTAAAEKISVIPSSGSKPLNSAHVIYTGKNLTAVEQPIISATKGAIDKNVNISYKGAGADAFVGYTQNNKTANIGYTVVYTIVSQ